MSSSDDKVDPIEIHAAHGREQGALALAIVTHKQQGYEAPLPADYSEGNK
jgi:hypothetical protein